MFANLILFLSGLFAVAATVYLVAVIIISIIEDTTY